MRQVPCYFKAYILTGLEENKHRINKRNIRANVLQRELKLGDVVVTMRSVKPELGCSGKRVTFQLRLGW